jgi:hypothetical protein
MDHARTRTKAIREGTHLHVSLPAPINANANASHDPIHQLATCNDPHSSSCRAGQRTARPARGAPPRGDVRWSLRRSTPVAGPRSMDADVPSTHPSCVPRRSPCFHRMMIGVYRQRHSRGVLHGLRAKSIFDGPT